MELGPRPNCILEMASVVLCLVAAVLSTTDCAAERDSATEAAQRGGARARDKVAMVGRGALACSRTPPRVGGAAGGERGLDECR